MNRFKTLFLVLSCISIFAAFQPTFSASKRVSSSHSSSRKSSSSSTKKPVHVRSYTRKDGTIVHAHTRSLPGTTAHKSVSGTHTKATKTYTSKSATSGKRSSISRSSHGASQRSEAAKNAFKRSHPCPATGKTSGPCKGYVIDHVIPLAKGGPDAPGNMQWQTEAAAKDKDRWERK